MKMLSHPNSLQTNNPGISKAFGIGNAAKIIGILRDKLYSNKIQTLCQEYISNGRDSHRELDKWDNAFEVTVPTHLNPVFEVRDYGVGISPDRMENVFILYGNSTKEDTNEQTGGLGIGAKSWFSYGDTFAITTFIDGVKRCYIAHLGSNNQGQLDLISTEETDELNGTKISGAVKNQDIYSFKNAIHRAVHFWDKKPILKGELNPPVHVSGTRIGDIEIVSSGSLPTYAAIDSYGDDMLALIDGIPYPIPTELVKKVPNLQKLARLIKQKVILHMGNGVVEVSASRESIADSKYSLDALSRIGSKACLEVSTHIKDAFAKVTDTPSYLNTYFVTSKDFVVDAFAVFGDYSINDGTIESALLKKIRIIYVSCLNSRRRRIEKVTRTELLVGRKSFNINNLNNIFYVSVDESKVKQNKRIKEYLKTHNELFIIAPLLTIEYDTVKKPDGTDEQVVKSKTLDTKSFDQVIKDLDVKDLQTVQYVEEPKEAKVKVLRENEQFCYHQLGYGRHNYTTLAKNTQKWFYFPLVNGGWGDYDPGDLKELSQYLSDTIQTKICGVGERTAKMIGNDPNYSLLTDYLNNYKPSKSDILIAKSAVSNHSSDADIVIKLKNIKDKFLVDMSQEYKTIFKENRRIPALIANQIAKLQEVKDFKLRDEKFGKLIVSDYPLLRQFQYGCHEWDEVAFYVNAKYKENK